MSCSHECNQGRACTCQPQEGDTNAAAIFARGLVAGLLIAAITSSAIVLVMLKAPGA
jgi:hypothetical protein